MDFNATVQMILVQFLPFVMAVVFHEYAHGYVAYRWGDRTALEEGRLTLNPIPHVHPVGTILMPLLFWASGLNILIGSAKPVPINPTQFKKYRPGLFWVSFAGPGMNFILAVLSSLAFCALVRFMPEDFYLFEPLTRMAQFSIVVNYALGVFNLIPIPPLDGSKMIQSFLSPQQTLRYEMLGQYSFFILLALVFSGALHFLFYPIQFLTKVTLYFSSQVFGLI